MKENNHKTYLITGANTGIGKATAIELSKRCHQIILFCRDSEKTKLALEAIQSANQDSDTHLIPVDLSERSAVEYACKQVEENFQKIDVLINNAGILKRNPIYSSDNIEITFSTNYLAPYLISRKLKPLLQKGSKPQIINVTSALYKNGHIPDDLPTNSTKFDGNKAYANSKLLNILDTFQLAEELQNDGISVNCLHPGVVGTDALREYPGWINWLLKKVLMKPEEAARFILNIADLKNVEKTTGTYFYKNKPEEIKNKLNLMEKYRKFEKEIIRLLL